MIRKFLFQLHLWSGLILGIIFVLIGLSGSISMLMPVFLTPPAVQVTTASTPALDKGLAAARAAVGALQWTDATITLPGGSREPVRIDFGGQMPAVLTDPGTGRVLATYSSEVPAWFIAINEFHGHLSIPDVRIGRITEGWLGVVMTFLGLTGLYLWWPKAGQWKHGFIVRRMAKGLRFHRELHGAAGIWTLVIYLVVTATGVAFEFPEARRAVATFLTGEGIPPRFGDTPIVIASAEAALIGPDAALAAARKASDRPVVQLQMPGWKPGWPNLLPIRATSNPAGLMSIYIDPYRGTIIPNPGPPPNNAYNIQRMMLRLHTAAGLGPLYRALVFISGLMPLIFFVTGLIMWLKKRQSRLAMSQPLPESVMGQAIRDPG